MGEGEESKKVDEQDDSKFGYLNWVHKLVDLSTQENSDVWLEKKIESMDKLR